MNNNDYYQEGYETAKSGQDKTQNPYHWLTTPWLEWNRGYNDYDAEAD